jgi:hypothetical protein
MGVDQIEWFGSGEFRGFTGVSVDLSEDIRPVLGAVR